MNSCTRLSACPDPPQRVLHRRGLEQAALRNGTGEQGISWVGMQGQAAAWVITEALGSDGPTAEMEMLRGGDLIRLLYYSSRIDAALRFGDEIKRIEQVADAATVTFSSRRTERYNVVIVAEGVGSPLRAQAVNSAARARSSTHCW